MPIYDYSCTACRHLVEVIHGIHDGGPLFCPNCGSEGTMRKGFSTPAVHFKGSGWAKKDRATSSASNRSSASKANTGSGSGSGSGEGSDRSSTGSADNASADNASADNASPDNASSASGSKPAGKSEKTAAAPAPDGGN